MQSCSVVLGNEGDEIVVMESAAGLSIDVWRFLSRAVLLELHELNYTHIVSQIFVFD
jgi:hypothetical protein